MQRHLQETSSPWLQGALEDQAENFGRKAKAKKGVQDALGGLAESFRTLPYADQLRITENLRRIREHSQG